MNRWIIWQESIGQEPITAIRSTRLAALLHLASVLIEMRSDGCTIHWVRPRGLRHWGWIVARNPNGFVQIRLLRWQDYYAERQAMAEMELPR